MIEGTPIWFAETILELKLYPWQDEVITWFENPLKRVKGTCAAPNGSGKSERVIATLALYVACMYKRGTCVITTADGKQLDNQIWPSIMKHRGRFPEWTFNERLVRTPHGGRIIAFTTDEPGRAEGWHKEMDGGNAGLISGPMMIICDEAKSIPEPIFNAIKLRCNFSWLLLISSTGIRYGTFYESHNDASFKQRRVTYHDCPHLDRDRIADLLLLGEDHPLVASTLLSKFMDQDDANSFFLTLEQFDTCLGNTRAQKGADRVAFCDFAAGSDENVLALRHGNKVTIEAAWTDRNTMAAAGRFLTEFRRLGLEGSQIFADEGGMGRPVIDRMAEMGWEINRVNNGAAPNDPRFRNRGSEMWYEGCSKIAQCEVILPNDKVLKSQLCSRKAIALSDGRIQAEKKEDMKKRGVSSPDRADAVLGAICHQEARPVQYNDPLRMPFATGEGWLDRFGHGEEESSGLRSGWDAGY